MEDTYRSLNTIAQFNDLNQWDEKETWYLCSLYAPAVNLKYNCWINLNEDDLKIIAFRQKAKWLLDMNYGWKWEDWIKAIYDYIVENHLERKWKIPNLKVFKSYNKIQQEDWLDRWYMLTIWIQVWKIFLEDVKDWKLDLFEDYNNYVWKDLWHFTNLTRWKCRFNKKGCEDKNKEQFIDSYSFNPKWNPWTYKCDIDKVLNSFAMETRYLFY